MGIHEVTNAQYRRFERDHDGKYSEGDNLGRDDQPVVYVSWEEATGFCKWLSQQTGLECRLSTEAEWEYACRAGTDDGFTFGSDPKELHHCGNYADKNTSFDYADKDADDGYRLTAPVGSYRPSAWGLYDMHGNVYEWCRDWYGESYYTNSPKEDPKGPQTGTGRVLCGGSWSFSPWYSRSAYRFSNWPSVAGKNGGFRACVRGSSLAGP